MAEKKVKTFYAPELSTQELRSFERLCEQGPREEIAVLRIMIRRMLQTLNQVKSFQEAIQTVNAISYLTGRLAKLFEVQGKGAEEAGEFESAYLLALNETIGKILADD